MQKDGEDTSSLRPFLSKADFILYKSLIDRLLVAKQPSLIQYLVFST